jgi:uncharacterized C2H2 Zn-finger protein
MELEALGKVVGVSITDLRLMLPSLGIGMKCEPIRLCGACYGDFPYHRLEWQFQSVWMCDKHQLKLLSKCPKCGARFKIPSLWEFGQCDRCRLFFGEMRAYQKSS